MECLDTSQKVNISKHTSNFNKKPNLRENSLFYDQLDGENEINLTENKRLSRKYLQKTFKLNDRFFCMICKRLIKEPIQTICGCRFCEKCFDNHVKLENKKCPSTDCNEMEITIKLRDRAIEREMKKISISCINDNCNADVFLFNLYIHLKNCPHSLIYCQKCFEKILLKNKIEHEENYCINRIVKCEFCSKDMSNFEYTNIHLNIECLSGLCDELLRKCPFECSSEKKFRIKSHLTKEHSIKEKSLSKNLSKEIDARISKYTEKITEIKNSQLELSKQINSVKQFKSEIENIKQNLSKELEFEISPINSTFVWKITDFDRLFNESKSSKTPFYLSSPFYTKEIGYKLFLKLYPNGDGSAKGSHLSIFIAIGKGKYDSLLTWPFPHKFKIQILNQRGNKNWVENFKPDSDSLCYQKPFKEINTATGNPKFIDLKTLFETDGYVTDHVLFIKCEVYV